jgi:DNA-binding XRE family transcriptional regulator
VGLFERPEITVITVKTSLSYVQFEHFTKIRQNYRYGGNFNCFSSLLKLRDEYSTIYYRDHSMNMAEITQAVKHHRKIAGLSQAKLGRIAGVGKTAVFDLEHGKETIRFDVVRKILEALNIRVKLGSPISRMDGEPGQRGE